MDVLGTTGATLMAGIGTSASTTFSSLAPVLVGVGGLFIGFWIVKKVIGLIPKK